MGHSLRESTFCDPYCFLLSSEGQGRDLVGRNSR